MTGLDPADSDIDDAESAQRELQAALDACGATSVHMCATGAISPAAMRAIAASVRSLESSEQDGADPRSVSRDGQLRHLAKARSPR